MKKFTACAVCLMFLLAAVLTGCGGAGSAADASPEEDVSTVQPEVVSDAMTAAPASSSENESENESGSSSSGASSPSSGTSGAVSPSVLIDEESESSAPPDSSMTTSGADSENGLQANEASLIYVILPSDHGSSATEASVIRADLEAAGYSIIVKTHGGDASAQSAAFNEAISAGAAAVICENIENNATSTDVQAAKDAGVPTFLIDKGIEVTGVAEAQVLTDRFSSVPALAQIFANNRNHRTSYIELTGASGDSRAGDAMAAFNDAMSAFPDMILAESDSQESYDFNDAKARIGLMLQNNPGAAALVCYNELQTTAGLSAIAEAGRDGTEVLCVCGDGDTIETLVSSGKVAASIVKPANELAETVSEEVLEFMKSGTYKSNERQYIDADILTAAGITR